MNSMVEHVPVRQWKRWLTLVLVGLGMLVFDLGVNDVDLLPDLAGRFVLLAAAAAAVPSTPRLPGLRALAVLTAVVAVVLDVVGRLGPDVAVAAGLADEAVVLSTAALAIRLAAALELQSRRRELLTAAVGFASTAVVATAAQLLGAGLVLTFVAGLTALALLVVLLVLLFLLRRDLRQWEGAQDSAGAPAELVR